MVKCSEVPADFAQPQSIEDQLNAASNTEEPTSMVPGIQDCASVAKRFTQKRRS